MAELHYNDMVAYARKVSLVSMKTVSRMHDMGLGAALVVIERMIAEGVLSAEGSFVDVLGNRYWLVVKS